MQDASDNSTMVQFHFIKESEFRLLSQTNIIMASYIYKMTALKNNNGFRLL